MDSEVVPGKREANAGQGRSSILLIPKAAFAVFLLALIIRFVVFLFAEPWGDGFLEMQFDVNHDAQGYHEIAVNLLDGQDSGIAGLRRTPGYPVFLASTYLIFGVDATLAILLQVIIGAATTFLVFYLVLNWFGSLAAIFASILYAIEPHMVLAPVTLLTDTLFVFLFTMAVCLFFKTVDKPRMLMLILVGFLLGLTTLVRPVSQFVLSVFVLFSVYYLYRRPIALVKVVSVISFAFVIAISPLLIKNYNEYGHLSLTNKGGQHLLRWVAAYTLVAKQNRPIDAVREDIFKEEVLAGYDESNNPFVNDGIQNELAMNHISENWPQFLLVEVKGVINTLLNLDTKRIAKTFGAEANDLSVDWYDTSAGFSDRVSGFFAAKSPLEVMIGALVAAIILFTYASAIAGVFLGLKEKKYYQLVFAVLAIGYFCALIGPIGVSRYKLPFLPFYLAFSGLFLSFLYKKYYLRAYT